MNQLEAQVVSRSRLDAIIAQHKGPPGYGKSYTDVYLRFVESATESVQYAYFDINLYWTFRDFVGSVFGRLGWREEFPRSELPEQQVVQTADFLMNRVRRVKNTIVLFIDMVPGNIKPDVQELILELCHRLTTSLHVPLALILSGFHLATAPGIERETKRLSLTECGTRHWTAH